MSLQLQYVAEVGLKLAVLLPQPPTSLELQTCATMPGTNCILKEPVDYTSFCKWESYLITGISIKNHKTKGIFSSVSPFLLGNFPHLTFPKSQGKVFKIVDL